MAMLSGLSSSPLTAHHCFNFLKANSPSLGGGGASAAISLDHFFHTLKQYYLALGKGGGVKATPTGCVITPQELQGLSDVLTLIRIIATHDDAARIVMYDNQTWLPVASLFGLVGCPIPRVLKAEILLTLAAFARSPEVAASMWHTLEATQILNTTSPSSAPSGGPGLAGPHGAQEGNIQVELEEMEAKFEEYPLTRAFLSLLDTLTDVAIPPTLGAGHRVPGFEPYLVFVRDTVFLKFDSRAYKQLEEKWEVASLALEILHKLLVLHDVSPDDFIEQHYQLPGGATAPVPSPPGHSILLHLMNDSQLLRKLLSVVAHASVQLLSPSPPPKNLDRAALLSLRLIETALTKEEVFMTALRQGSQSEMATPLHQLLLGINPHTKSADHLVNIARFVSAEGVSPELALTAVQILLWASRSSKAGKDIAKAIASNKDVCAEVLYGFVEHLEWEDSQASMATSGEGTVAGVHRDVQLCILRLLSLGLENPSPNLAHLLLGFDKGRETNLQDPGVLDSSRTCLHSILLLVEHGPDPNNPIGCHCSNPKLAMLCYKVIYQLSASRELSTPTLRYLRNNHDFFLTQLSKLPFNIAKLSSSEDELFQQQVLNTHQASLILQQAWLMKTIAIELRMTSLNHQVSHTQRLVNLLLSESSSQDGDATAINMGLSDFKSEFDFLQEGRRKILILLDLVAFNEVNLLQLDLQFFDQLAMEQAITSCDTQEEGNGATFTDVKMLHRMLLGELATLHGAGAAGQKQSVLQEIHGILDVVVARNRIREHHHSYQTLFESWRQLVEVLLHSLSHNSLKQELCVAVLFELVQDLLLKISTSEGSQLAGAVHGVVLVLISHLRQTVATATVERNESLLTTVFSGPLHGIMRGLMESLLKTPAANQQDRSFLYGSLLYYLVLCRQDEGDDGKRKGPTSLWQSDREANSVVSGNLSALNSFGEPFMDTLCKNACSGHDVARMLSLSLLDAIVSLDWQGQWLRFLCLKGYLQTLCASLQWEDEALQRVLHSTSEEMRALYIYDSKMAFLTRVASSQHGCRELISLNCLGNLTQCHFIDRRPSSHGASYHSDGMDDTMGFAPSVVERYRQLFLPLLRFLLAALMTPGPQHKEACSQVTALIAVHSDVFAAVLKEQPPIVTMATLQELSLVTAVVCHSGVGHDWSPQGITSSSSEGSGLVRIQRLMLTLLPHFWSKQNLQKLVGHVLEGERGEGSGAGGDEDPVMVEKASLLTLQVTANLVAYCRVAMTMGGEDFSSPCCRIVLTPDLSEALAAVPTAEVPLRPGFPSLGLLVRFLKECTEGYSLAAEDHMAHSRKLDNAGNLATDEIRKLLPSFGSDKLLSWQQQALAKRRLLELLASKKQKLHQYAYIVENLLYVLWRHLQYYLVHCRPVEPEAALGVGGVFRQPMRRMQDTRHGSGYLDTSTLTDGVTMSELEQLKTGSTKCLTDPLFKKLLDLEETQLASRVDVRVGFIQALVRRVRRLLKLKAAPPHIIST